MQRQCVCVRLFSRTRWKGDERGRRRQVDQQDLVKTRWTRLRPDDEEDKEIHKEGGQKEVDDQLTLGRAK